MKNKINYTKIAAYVAACISAIGYGTTILFTNKLVSNADVLNVLSMRFLLAAAVVCDTEICLSDRYKARA